MKFTILPDFEANKKEDWQSEDKNVQSEKMRGKVGRITGI